MKREPRKYDIVALRDSVLLHLPAPSFRWLIDTSLQFNHFILSQLNERLAQYIMMVEIDRLHDPVERVARSISTLFNPILYPSMTAAIPLSQQELGELVGISRQSVGAALKRLEGEGLIAVRYGEVIVLRLDQLREYRERP